MVVLIAARDHHAGGPAAESQPSHGLALRVAAGTSTPRHFTNVGSGLGPCNERLKFLVARSAGQISAAPKLSSVATQASSGAWRAKGALPGELDPEACDRR
jgi:hypothetical protein